jgi:NADH dehydrogenase/NADH:ubiquinone oxidoreductase subunit G
VAALIIDGLQVEAPAGVTLLDALHELGLDVPSLCHLDGLPTYGACRLCLVEMVDPDGSDGEPEVVAACTYPVKEGLVVNTKGKRAAGVRRMMLEFMLARCPESAVIQSLAAEAGLEGSRFTTDGDEDELCILCGLCVRVCRDLVGAAAIGYINRGSDRIVGTPFQLNSDDCIGCCACAAVCPTGAVRIEDKNGQRLLHTWNTTVPLHTCPECGTPYAPEPMAFLREQVPVSADLWGLCPQCRRQGTVNQLDIVRDAALYG